MEKSTQIDITIGESFKGFEARYPSVKVSGQDLKEFGVMKFYEMDWKPSKAATITVKNDGVATIFSYAIHLGADPAN